MEEPEHRASKCIRTSTLVAFVGRHSRFSTYSNLAIFHFESFDTTERLRLEGPRRETEPYFRQTPISIPNPGLDWLYLYGLNQQRLTI